MKHLIAVRLAGFALAVAVTGSCLAADMVYRHSNSTPLQGEITGSTRTEVTIKPRVGDEVTVPVNDISRVRWDGEPAGLNLARTDEDGGRLQKALEGYEKAAGEIPADNADLKRDLDYLMARTKAKMALADPSQVDEAIKGLEDFRKANADSFRYYDLVDYLGRLYMAKRDIGNAKSMFTLLEQAPWNDYKMAAQISNARVLLLEDNVSGALQAFNAVASQPAQEPGELSRRFEAMLGKAICLQRQMQHGEAVETLEQVIDQVAARDTRVQAEAYLRQGDSLQAQGKVKEAVLAYLRVDVLFPMETALHAEALYHLAQLWPNVGHPDRGAEARAKLDSDYPNSEWNQRLSNVGS